MKNKFFLMRLAENEKKAMARAARKAGKSVAAFLLYAGQAAIRYRYIFEQIKTIEREYESKNLKMPQLEVRVK